MKFDDISWGRYPELDSRLDQSEEIELIDEWRVWNSDYKVGLSLLESQNKDMAEFGERVVIKTAIEMSKICKKLTDIRKGE